MEIFVAHLVNGLLSGSLYVLAAVATTFLLLIAGFIQFAHGEVITIAMYVAWLVLTKTNDHLFLGVSAAIVIAILTTIVMEPLIRSSANARVFLNASFLLLHSE